MENTLAYYEIVENKVINLKTPHQWQASVWKLVVVANYLAYSIMAINTAIKCFIIQATVENTGDYEKVLHF